MFEQWQPSCFIVVARPGKMLAGRPGVASCPVPGSAHFSRWIIITSEHTTYSGPLPGLCRTCITAPASSVKRDRGLPCLFGQWKEPGPCTHHARATHALCNTTRATHAHCITTHTLRMRCASLRTHHVHATYPPTHESQLQPCRPCLGKRKGDSEMCKCFPGTQKLRKVWQHGHQSQKFILFLRHNRRLIFSCVLKSPHSFV